MRRNQYKRTINLGVMVGDLIYSLNDNLLVDLLKYFSEEPTKTSNKRHTIVCKHGLANSNSIKFNFFMNFLVVGMFRFLDFLLNNKLDGLLHSLGIDDERN